MRTATFKYIRRPSVSANDPLALSQQPISQSGSDGDGRVDASEDGPEENELADADVDGQRGQVEAQGRELILGVEGAHPAQAVHGRGHRRQLRGLDQPRQHGRQ